MSRCERLPQRRGDPRRLDRHISTDSVLLTDVNEAVAAEGTAEAIEEAKAKLVSGELQVFDISTFTVGGETLESHMADVDTDPDYEPDTEGR